MDQCLIRLKELVEVSHRSKSQIYRDIKAGTFPPPVKIGGRSSAWKVEEVQSWVNGLIPRGVSK